LRINGTFTPPPFRKWLILQGRSTEPRQPGDAAGTREATLKKRFFQLKFPADTMRLHGLGAVAAIRLAPTRTGTLIVRPVRVRSECLSVDNRNDQHRGKYGCPLSRSFSFSPIEPQSRRGTKVASGCACDCRLPLFGPNTIEPLPHRPHQDAPPVN
jgi:hypothetical protein